LIAAGFKCELCGYAAEHKSPRKSMKEFHLHHRSYGRLGDEENADVQILCIACHMLPETHPWRKEISA
jgi:hypothetical protein